MARQNLLATILLLSSLPLAASAADGSGVVGDLFSRTIALNKSAPNDVRYPIKVNVDTTLLFGLQPRSRLKLALPGIDNHIVIFDEAAKYAGGVREWRGHLQGQSDLRITLVDAQGITTGYLQTPQKNLRLGYDNGINWITVDTAAVKVMKAAAIGDPVLSIVKQPVSETEMKRMGLPTQGAYETHTDVIALSTMPENSETSITLPNAGSYRVIYEGTATSDSGASTWAGYLRDYGNDYRVMLTYTPTGVEGQLLTPAGEYLIRTIGSKQYVIDVSRAGLTHPPIHNSDALMPQTAAITSTTSTQTTTTSTTTTTTSTTTASSTVDLLVLYTPGFVTRQGANVQNRIDQVVALANQAYKDSGIAINLRVVGREMVSYTDANNNSTALAALAGGTDPAFANVPTLRQKYGADLVTLIRPFNVTSQVSCGVAYIGGYGGQPIRYFASQAFSVVSDGTDPGGRYYCTDYSLVHELGHNMGSMHDRATVASQGGGTGAYPYAFGYGLSGVFGTVMSYVNPRIGKFSNPLDKTCGGTYVCGVSETNTTSSANNTLSINNTRSAVAAFRTTTVATSFGISGTVGVSGAPLKGVTLTGSGLSCTASGTNGVYSCSAPQGWSGVITPSLAGYKFLPTSITLSNLQASKSGQNFTATVGQ